MGAKTKVDDAVVIECLMELATLLARVTYRLRRSHMCPEHDELHDLVERRVAGIVERLADES